MADARTRSVRVSVSEVATALRGKLSALRSGELSFAAVALTVVFGSLLGIVVLQTFIVQNRVQLDTVNRQLDDARDENRRLRLEVIELESPDRILESAVERIGMIRPDQRRYLPGIDPEIASVRLPPAGDPFGPGLLPEWLLPQPEPEPVPPPEPEPAETAESEAADEPVEAEPEPAAELEPEPDSEAEPEPEPEESGPDGTDADADAGGEGT